MRLTVSTWNINSVRLRIDLVGQFLADVRPDVLCLQETKCPDDKLPLNELRGFGYPHLAHVGQKGYNGVAILSRLPFAATETLSFCGREDARHVAVTLAPAPGTRAATGVTIHNFYVPAGGDIPDPGLNEKFAHKLGFLAEMRAWAAARARGPAILVGDLNVAPLEHDVWSHRQMLDVVSHTPVETEALESLRREGGWVDAARRLTPEPAKLYTWWSYRSPDWRAADKGRRLDHIWLTDDLAGALRDVAITKDARGWTRPSDHVPVTAVLEL